MIVDLETRGLSNEEVDSDLEAVGTGEGGRDGK